MYKIWNPNLCLRKRGIPKLLLVMKLTILLLTTAILQVSASSFAQRITLSEKNAKLTEIFDKIRVQTGYDFLVTKSVLKNANPVNIEVKNERFLEVLKKVFAGQNLNYSFKNNAIIVTEKLILTTFPATIINLSINVTGKVVDEKGLGLPGATIKVKGANRAEITDNAGRFAFKGIDENAILVVSYLGYVPLEIRAEGKSEMLIALTPQDASLSEIVVVGYGTQKKENLTGAVAQVDKKMLENRPIVRLSQALQGVVGNLNISSNNTGGAPNAKQDINIRGFTGFGAKGSPLLVIDGVPGGDINTINPNDIENISVLKDQASAAIYGVDGAFGVILINTKQGKKGAAPQISYDNNISYAQLMNSPKTVGSLEYVTMWNEAAQNAGSTPIYPEEQIQRVKDYLAGTLKSETQANASNTDWNNGQLGNANNNWFDILFKKWGISQQHNIGVSGGSSSINYYVGLGYNDVVGMYSYGNDNFKRYNFRGNLGADVTSWMKVNVRTSFSRSNSDMPFEYPARTGGGLSGYMHQAARVAPVVPLYNPDGNLSNFSDPAWMGSGSRRLENLDQTFLTGEFVLAPIKGLNITGNYSLFATYNESSAQGKTFYIPKPDGSLATFGVNPNTFSRTLGKANNQLINLFSSYERSFGDHNFKILGGYIRRFNESLSVSASNSNLYTDNLPSLSLTYNDKPIVSDAIEQLGTQGYFTRFNYNYKEKYLVEFNGRYDATSRFITKRWQFYPGVSAGYVVSNEEFWKPVKNTLNFFKIRASYGQSGDQASLSLYPFYQSMVTVAPGAGTSVANNPNNWFFSNGRQAYVSAPGVINPNITWQKPVMIDYGFDAELLKNRLSVSFDWYKRTMRDMIVASAPLPATFGTAAPTINAGEMETKGFELTLGWKDQVGDFRYAVKALLSDYTGKVTKYPNPTQILSDFYVGQHIGDIWGYTSTGLYANDQAAAGALPASFWNSTWKGGDVIYQDLDQSGRIDNGKNTVSESGDLSIIGNNTPRYSYGLTLDLAWKNFDFNAFIQGVAKRDVWVNSNYFWGITGDRFQSSFFDIHRDRWTAENPGGYYPKYYMSSEMAKNEVVQTRYLQNGAYLRFKNVQLGYSLPKHLIERVKINRLRFYVSVENLATITKMVKSIDPELAVPVDGAIANVNSSDGKIYPLRRTFSFGLNLTL